MTMHIGIVEFYFVTEKIMHKCSTKFKKYSKIASNFVFYMYASEASLGSDHGGYIIKGTMLPITDVENTLNHPIVILVRILWENKLIVKWYSLQCASVKDIVIF